MNKFQTWAAEINEDWIGGYVATATDESVIVSFDNVEAARVDYNGGRYTVSGTDQDAVDQLQYMVER